MKKTLLSASNHKKLVKQEVKGVVRFAVGLVKCVFFWTITRISVTSDLFMPSIVHHKSLGRLA